MVEENTSKKMDEDLKCLEIKTWKVVIQDRLFLSIFIIVETW